MALLTRRVLYFHTICTIWAVLYISNTLADAETCSVGFNMTALRESQRSLNMSSCVSNRLTNNNDKTHQWSIDCMVKCAVQKRGYLTGERKYNPTALEDFMKTYSNSTDAFISAVTQAVGKCVKLGEELITVPDKSQFNDCPYYTFVVSCGRLAISQMNYTEYC